MQSDIEPPKFIDLEPGNYRHTSMLENPTIRRVLMRGAALAGIWFAVAVVFGQYADHGQPWFVIASAAVAPLALLFFVAASLD